MTKLTLWMRVVGVFYLFQFVAMAIVRAPVRTQGPAGTLALARGGDPLAKFVVDTWLTFGLEVLAIGVAMLVLSRRPLQGRGLAWTVLGIELSRGLVSDVLMVSRGDLIAFYSTWIVLHLVVIVTGLLVLRVTPERSAETPHDRLDTPSRSAVA